MLFLLFLFFSSSSFLRTQCESIEFESKNVFPFSGYPLPCPYGIKAQGRARTRDLIKYSGCRFMIRILPSLRLFLALSRPTLSPAFFPFFSETTLSPRGGFAAQTNGMISLCRNRRRRSSLSLYIRYSLRHSFYLTRENTDARRIAIKRLV